MKKEDGKCWFTVLINGRNFWTKQATRYKFFYSFDSALKFARKAKKNSKDYEILIDTHCPHSGKNDNCMDCASEYELYEVKI